MDAAAWGLSCRLWVYPVKKKGFTYFVGDVSLFSYSCILYVPKIGLPKMQTEQNKTKQKFDPISSNNYPQTL